ncbi:hypothetical protein NA57DRAFT_59284 [Rhizodiscina lignyota]|uniref:Uncharacterized protein n=1 Tax=Rhizodiscina lignyota TaxID=1504668 RepID=A0A9P4IA21_9PEZI|nr:hypothetical protein NA57DRAFT_59284 [Rhizodiscina lignyota]
MFRCYLRTYFGRVPAVYIQGAGFIEKDNAWDFIDPESMYRLPVARSSLDEVPVLWRLEDGSTTREIPANFPQPKQEVVTQARIALMQGSVLGKLHYGDYIAEMRQRREQAYDANPGRRPGFRAIADAAPPQPRLAITAGPEGTGAEVPAIEGGAMGGGAIAGGMGGGRMAGAMMGEAMLGGMEEEMQGMGGNHMMGGMDVDPAMDGGMDEMYAGPPRRRPGAGGPPGMPPPYPGRPRGYY